MTDTPKPAGADLALLPCPFCGSRELVGLEEQQLGKVDGIDQAEACVRCRKCGGQGRSSWDDRKVAVAKAVFAWNARAALSPALEGREPVKHLNRDGAPSGTVPGPSTQAAAAELLSLDSDTGALVNRFMLALADKLARARIKYGFTNEWLTEEWEAKCRVDLLAHVQKGDPLDVAAYAAFCWARGWTTTPQPAGAEREALARLEKACKHVAAGRPQAVYQAMIDAGQSDALLELAHARRDARNTLALRPQPAPVQDEAWAERFFADVQERFPHVLDRLRKEDATPCVSGEGKPAPENNPCATCGRVQDAASASGWALGENDFEVWQDGFPVATVSSPNRADAVRDARHYALMYGQDGPVELFEVIRRPFALTSTTTQGEG